MEEYKYLKSPRHFTRKIFYEDWRTKKQVLGYLDVINIINFYWGEEFKDKPKSWKSNCVLIKWDKKDALDSLFAIIFGLFPENYNLKYNFKGVFLKGLKAKLVNIKNGEDIDASLARTVYPLKLTADKLQCFTDGWGQKYGIYIGNPNDFDDLLNIWDIRASGVALQFLPINSKRLNPFIRKHLSVLYKILNRDPNIKDPICVYSKDINEAKEYS